MNKRNGAVRVSTPVPLARASWNCRNAESVYCPPKRPDPRWKHQRREACLTKHMLTDVSVLRDVVRGRITPR